MLLETLLLFSFILDSLAFFNDSFCHIRHHNGRRLWNVVFAQMMVAVPALAVFLFPREQNPPILLDVPQRFGGKDPMYFQNGKLPTSG
jgi:hypothetical protein